MKAKNLTTNEVVEIEITKIEASETLEQKIARLKSEYEEQIKELKKQEKDLKEQAKALKEEADKAKKEAKEKQSAERAEKMKELLANKPEVKENKSQVIRELMLKGYTKDQIVKETNYTNKFVLDNMWRIEKSLGLR